MRERKFVDVKSGEEIEPTEDEVGLTVQRIKAHNMLRNMIIKEEK